MPGGRKRCVLLVLGRKETQDDERKQHTIPYSFIEKKKLRVHYMSMDMHMHTHMHMYWYVAMKSTDQSMKELGVLLVGAPYTR